MEQSMIYLKKLREEYDKVKDDPLKLQLFTVKHKSMLDIIQKTQSNNTTEIKNTNKDFLIHTDTHNKLPQPHTISNVNNINPLNTKNMRNAKLSVSEYIGIETCPTKYVQFRMKCPNKWMYAYGIEILSYNNIEKTGLYKLDINTIPRDHIVQNKTECNVKIYAYDGVWNEIFVCFTPNAQDEMGNVIYSHTIIPTL